MESYYLLGVALKLVKQKVMKTNYPSMAVLSLLCGCYVTTQVEYLSPPMNGAVEYLSHEVFPWVIGGIGFLKIFLAIFYRFRGKLPRFPSLINTWLASIQIYIGTAVDVLVCFGSLLRINLRYICLAIVPLMAIYFISVLYLRQHNKLSSHDDGMSGHDDCKKKTTTMKNKESTVKPEKLNTVVLLNNGLNTSVMPEEFNVVVLLAPHIILTVSGMVGDPDHDGNNYDMSNWFLFLTCVLQELTFISSDIAPASELLYKASLVVLLLTAHVLAVNAFGRDVVLILLPEVVPPLLWLSLHVDRRTPIINVQKIVGSEHFVFKAVVVAMCGCILQVVPEDESLLYWAITSCAASGFITCIIVLVLRLWPEKAGFATLSSEELLELLTCWGKLLLQVAVGLLAFGIVVWLKSTVHP